MTALQLWLFAIAGPALAAAVAFWAGWSFRGRRVDQAADDAYDRGWDNCKTALGFAGVPKQLVNDAGPPAGRRPGRHASTQLPDPPKPAGPPFLPAPPAGASIRRKTS